MPGASPWITIDARANGTETSSNRTTSTTIAVLTVSLPFIESA
jgi:hypothetical protein